MSDYLSNLVARTLNLEPVVQPRRASFFEPAFITAGRIPGAPIETETLFENLPSNESTPRSPTEFPESAQAPLTPPRITGTTEANVSEQGEIPGGGLKKHEPAARSVADPIASDSASSSLPRPLIPRAISIQPAQVQVPRLAHHESSELNIESNEQRAVTSKTVSEQGWPRQPVEEAQQLTGENLTRLEPAAPIRAARFRSQQSRKLSGSTSRLTVDGPPSVPGSPAPRIVHERIAPADTAPTIKVTIGRVDVRAIIPPPSPGPRTPRPPRMAPTSLDEYLKKQSEGRRE